MVGPTARETLKATPVRVIASGKSLRGTNSGTIACHAGLFSAEPRPKVNVSTNSDQGVISRLMVSTPISIATTNIHVCVTNSSLRRSIRSAMAPAGKAKSTMGRLPAVLTSATNIGEPVKENINQDSPTSFIHVPRFEAIVAIQRARKMGPRKGPNEGKVELLPVLSPAFFTIRGELITVSGFRFARLDSVRYSVFSKWSLV